uniref:Reverse transcriptase/retrotransposon-derived protein RNase H-like domain-containing protein n=1 Tax=Oreochromis aureus TaxID=47969 RepID=A0AAZ1WWZ1_OREAU
MPRPTDKRGVLRVIGMINFVGKFIPNLSVRTSALRELLCDSIEFKWTARHEQEWNDLKTTLTTRPVLAYYDPTKSLKISTDASKDGLGAVLLQAEEGSWKPVAYASRSMSKSETRYAQTEKECLGLAYGLDIFHCYVYGLPTFTVETDHRPLVSNIKRNLNEMSLQINDTKETKPISEEKQAKPHDTLTKWIWFPSISGACGPGSSICTPVVGSTSVSDSVAQSLLLPRITPVIQIQSLWMATCNL